MEQKPKLGVSPLAITPGHLRDVKVMASLGPWAYGTGRKALENTGSPAP